MTEPYLASSLPAQQLTQLYRLMTEEIQDVALFFMNTEGIITTWNRGAEEMKGYTAEDAIGQHLRLLYTEEDRAEQWPEHNLKEASRLGFFREERWRQRKDGTLFWANISLTALRNHDGMLVGYSKITLDLTPHLRLEQCLNEKEESSRILRAARAGTWKWDSATDTIDLSPHFLALLGYDHAQQTFAYDQWVAYIHPDDRGVVREQLHVVRHERQPHVPVAMQMRIRRSGGGYHWFFIRADWHREKDGDPLLLMGVNVDIQALKTAQEEQERLFRQLQVEEEQARVTLAAIADGVITTGLDRNIISINPAAERLTGWTAAKAIGVPVEDVFHLIDDTTHAPVPGLVEQCLKLGRGVHDDRTSLLVNRQGTQLSVDSSAAPIRLASGQVTGAVLAFHDVNESRRLLHQLHYQATHDALTGQINRAEFESRLQRTLDHAQRSPGQDSVLLYMDLDQFKIVNDTCGHTDGDELLRQLAQIYQGHVSERDTLARIGGDEFAVIIDRCTINDAIGLADRILAATKKFRFVCKGHLFQIGISIGLVPINSQASSIEKLLREADHACYLAKEAGRNQVYVQQSGDIDIAQRRNDMQWVRRLDDAFQNDRLRLYYQPIVPILENGDGLHYEILLRLNDEEDNLIGPATFLPAAERYDVMPAVDRWVLRTSLEWLERNPDHVAALETCTINLSRRTLADESFLKYAIALLDASAVPATKICFEITENGAIANLERTLSFIETIAERGCKFSLDDFGAGMTSFSNLKQLPVDYIKIDGSFIQMMSGSAVDYEMVRFTNDISHMMGRKTIAEHVTSESILHKLREIGVDFAQGYWLGPPQPLTI